MDTNIATPGHGAVGAGSLADPATCGEDHAANIRRALDYAPGHCGQCLNYHMLFPIRRGIGHVGFVARDRGDVIATVGGLLRARAAAVDGPVDIVVAGAADTQIPAACAHAALVHGGDAFARARFTIIDSCDTPLQLCRDFAARHGVAFATHVADLAATEARFPADILIHHSLLNFVPAESHVAVLGKLAAWLKPGGRIVFSMSLKPHKASANHRDTQAEADNLVRAALDSGTLAIAEPREVFEDRLQHRHRRLVSFNDAAEVRALIARCGLKVHADERIVGLSRIPGGAAFERERVFALLGRNDT